MPKKVDLATALGQRRKQQEAPAEPVEPVVPQDALAEATRALHPVPATTEKRSPAPARAPARTKETTTGGVIIEEIYKELQHKKHLASYTLRFRQEELADLESVYSELNEAAPGVLSRNDIARAALLWLLKDYRQRGEQSVLEQIANRG